MSLIRTDYVPEWRLSVHAQSVLAAGQKHHNGNFNFFHGNGHGIFRFARPPVIYGGGQWPCTKSSKPKFKSRYLKSIFLEEKSENHKSKVDSRTSRTKVFTCMRLGQTQTGMSSYRSPYISFHVFTLDRSKNELRPV